MGMYSFLSFTLDQALNWKLTKLVELEEVLHDYALINSVSHHDCIIIKLDAERLAQVRRTMGDFLLVYCLG